MKWAEAIETARLIQERVDGWWIASIDANGSLVGEDRYEVSVLKMPSMHLRLTAYEPFARVAERLREMERGYTWPAQAQSAEQFREAVTRAYIEGMVTCVCLEGEGRPHLPMCPFEWLHRAGRWSPPRTPAPLPTGRDGDGGAGRNEG
jgi:hypothetical protein